MCSSNHPIPVGLSVAAFSIRTVGHIVATLGGAWRQDGGKNEVATTDTPLP